jgi:hypothetical protein
MSFRRITLKCERIVAIDVTKDAILGCAFLADPWAISVLPREIAMVKSVSSYSNRR